MKKILFSFICLIMPFMVNALEFTDEGVNYKLSALKSSCKESGKEIFNGDEHLVSVLSDGSYIYEFKSILYKVNKSGCNELDNKEYVEFINSMYPRGIAIMDEYEVIYDEQLFFYDYYGYVLTKDDVAKSGKTYYRLDLIDPDNPEFVEVDPTDLVTADFSKLYEAVYYKYPSSTTYKNGVDYYTLNKSTNELTLAYPLPGEDVSSYFNIFYDEDEAFRQTPIMKVDKNVFEKIEENNSLMEVVYHKNGDEIYFVYENNDSNKLVVYNSKGKKIDALDGLDEAYYIGYFANGKFLYAVIGDESIIFDNELNVLYKGTDKDFLHMIDIDKLGTIIYAAVNDENDFVTYLLTEEKIPESPKTFDSIVIYKFISIISLVSLITSIFYLKKRFN